MIDKFEQLLEILSEVHARGMDPFAELIAIARAIRSHYGYSKWDGVVKTMNRERLQNLRLLGNIHYPWSEYKKLYSEQRGICAICQEAMVLLKNGEIWMDHIDPNAADFEARLNRQVTHKKCNQEKSAKSILQQSKETGKSFTELIKPHAGEPTDSS